MLAAARRASSLWACALRGPAARSSRGALTAEAAGWKLGAVTPRAEQPGAAASVGGGSRAAGTWGGWRQSSSWQQSAAADAKTRKQEKSRWQFLSKVEKAVNPCNSPLHPAAKIAGIAPEAEHEKCIQEAYNPNSECYGCGTKSAEGLHLKSYRADNGLQAVITFDKRHQAFPGIVNGGVIATVMDCHANWTAAVALMDRACTARPPLTLSHHLQLTFASPVPVGQPLTMISQVKRIDEADGSSNIRTSVKVEVRMFLEGETEGTPLAEGMGIFKKMGAVREM
mmetsp:Transcript_45054/g.114054  ORF Transcript_45054/g.114054 Transcript_45054/m.114054 type:complete len:283 (-) Transcript_45054:336-1184(-)